MKTATAAVIVGCVAFVSIVTAMTVILVTGHDLTPFSIAFGSICTSVAGFLAIIPILRKQAMQIAKVDKQTNGTLSKLLADANVKDAKLSLALSLLTPDQAREVLEHTMSRDEILQFLREDSATVSALIANNTENTNV